MGLEFELQGRPLTTREYFTFFRDQDTVSDGSGKAASQRLPSPLLNDHHSRKRRRRRQKKGNGRKEAQELLFLAQALLFPTPELAPLGFPAGRRLQPPLGRLQPASGLSARAASPGRRPCPLDLNFGYFRS